MARLARLVIPGLPHHITQRGNRRQQTFFNDGDYSAYLELMSDWCREEGVEIWGYCLMPNHVHLIAVPKTEDGLRRAIGEAHRRYTRRINFREKWRGYLWQGRFASFIMDEPYLLAAARVWGVESRASETGGRRRRMALEQCQGALVGPRRPPGNSRSLVGNGQRLAQLLEQCDRRRGASGLAIAWAYRSAVGKQHVPGTFGGYRRSRIEAAERRPSVKTTQSPITSNMSPESPPISTATLSIIRRMRRTRLDSKVGEM